MCGALEPRCRARKPGALEPWGAQTVIKVDEIKAKFAERFQILEETNPTQILPVYANAKQKP